MFEPYADDDYAEIARNLRNLSTPAPRGWAILAKGAARSVWISVTQDERFWAAGNSYPVTLWTTKANAEAALEDIRLRTRRYKNPGYRRGVLQDDQRRRFSYWTPPVILR